MIDQDELKAWIESNCPLFWSLLNRKARASLPKGVIEYIGLGSSSEIKTGRYNLATIERHLAVLKNLCGPKAVGDNYRRDFSHAASENQLSELFCEIALCASVGKLSGSLRLRPSTGKGTHCDCLFNVHDFEVYGEAKRFADPWPPREKTDDVPNKEILSRRSIAERPPGEKPDGSARPRSMDLRCKLRDVHKQFPEGSLNMAFRIDLWKKCYVHSTHKPD